MDTLDLEGKLDLKTSIIIWKRVNVPDRVFDLVERDSTMRGILHVAYVPHHICMVDGLPRYLDEGGYFAPSHTEQLPYKEGILVIGYQKSEPL